MLPKHSRAYRTGRRGGRTGGKESDGGWQESTWITLDGMGWDGVKEKEAKCAYIR